MTIEHLRADYSVLKLPEPRSEAETMAAWKGDLDKPVVSICCATYNHEPYIEDALKGFLIQETDFPFEILIHDDASTDRTVEIIREYEAKYPRLIKPIYQTENQYSKGLKVNPTFNFPRAKGEYIALCEGDDCWLSVDKLTRQVEACSADCVSVVFHSAVEINMDAGFQQVVSRQRDFDSVIPLVESVEGRGAFMPTASLFFRSEIIKSRLDWFESDWPIGDFFLQMILSYEGKIYYIDEPMCLYRRNVPGSWTDKQNQRSEAIRYHKAMVRGLLELYDLLGDRKAKHLLADPTFFYAKGVLFSQNNPFVAALKLVTSVFSWNVSWSFRKLYLNRAIFLPFSMILRKIKYFKS